jgi:ParB family chromosome partitioning protein
MDPLVTLPTDAIDADALLCDRAAPNPQALDDFVQSILHDGLRQPIEVFALPDSRYGLISGLRRLTAVRTLAALNDRFSTIPAFLRTPASLPAALAAMVAENEIRSQITPWEKGRLIMQAVWHGHFDTPDAAVAALYPTASRQARARLRSFALVVESLDGTLTTPWALPVARMETLGAALRGGFEELIDLTLSDVKGAAPDVQWAALHPVLAEAMAPPDPALPEGATTPRGAPRPRRVLHLKQGLTIRREWSRTGWILRSTGPEAKSGGLMDDVFDLVERWCQPGEG